MLQGSSQPLPCRLPDGLTGEDLFNHMLKFGARDPKYSPSAQKDDVVRKPSTWLDVEMTDDQVEVMRPKSIDRMLTEAMKDAGLVAKGQR